jgi:hypothetical protein
MGVQTCGVPDRDGSIQQQFHSKQGVRSQIEGEGTELGDEFIEESSGESSEF